MMSYKARICKLWPKFLASKITFKTAQYVQQNGEFAKPNASFNHKTSKTPVVVADQGTSNSSSNHDLPFTQ